MDSKADAEKVAKTMTAKDNQHPLNLEDFNQSAHWVKLSKSKPKGKK